MFRLSHTSEVPALPDQSVCGAKQTKGEVQGGCLVGIEASFFTHIAAAPLRQTAASSRLLRAVCAPLVELLVVVVVVARLLG